MLEVIDKGCPTESHPMPLLFGHGACSTAWAWDEHFLDFFADKGYRAVALSLRGHGASDWNRDVLSSQTIAVPPLLPLLFWEERAGERRHCAL